MSALGDHVVDVVVEFAPRLHHALFQRMDVGGEAERLEDHVGPRREPLPVLTRCAEQRGDDRDRVRARDVLHDIAIASPGDPIDEIVQHADHGVVQARHRSRRERPGAQAPQPLMLVALKAQNAGGHLVPQRAGGNALGLQHDALRHLEPLVSQHCSDHRVRENFGPEGADRDGCLFLRLAEAWIDLRRVLVGAVIQRREIGIRKSHGGGTDGHDGLL